MAAACQSCGGPDVRSDAAHEQMPYCATCYYSGRASTHYAAAILQPLRDAGFMAEGWQTGGGCQNIALPLTEGGWDGPHALMGNIDSLNPADWDLGLQLEAHPDRYELRGTEYMEWSWIAQWRDDCPACAVLALLEEDLQDQFHQIEDPVRDLPVAAEALVNIARQVAVAVHQQKENHT
jgi:hypothetical protein